VPGFGSFGLPLLSRFRTGTPGVLIGGRGFFVRPPRKSQHLQLSRTGRGYSSQCTLPQSAETQCASIFVV
jgi:hypothetical protein